MMRLRLAAPVLVFLAALSVLPGPAFAAPGAPGPPASTPAGSPGKAPNAAQGQGPTGNQGKGPTGNQGKGPPADTRGKGPSPNAGDLGPPAGKGAPGASTPGPSVPPQPSGAPVVSMPDQDQAMAAVRSGAAMPLADLLVRASADFDGDVIDARLILSAGFLIYELKVLSPDKSTVRTLFYYARSGIRIGTD
ncbi:MAG TPA: hypothetical protein VFO41_07490 [Alphaproteobacteria bacterium]|nr:hypothetical protein [Alphaproteobacteria bacterium]